MAGLEVESLTPLREPESQREDWLFEIAVTPNRGDCLGLAGIAREVCALTGAKVRHPAASMPARKIRAFTSALRVKIEDAAQCARYSARIVDNVRIAPAPAWLRFRLEACGIRAINNIVDVTNYVMLETGQPLHAFDLARLSAKQIVVRKARENRKFTTLDGVERELAHEDLVICDGDSPVALAGVMGGMNSEVSAATQSILLESANFAPAAIRRTAKRLALHSEASHRFERGVDPEGTIRGARSGSAIDHSKAAAAVLRSGVADRYPKKIAPLKIRVREQRIEKLLGIGIELKQAENSATLLGFEDDPASQILKRRLSRPAGPTSLEKST